MDADEAQSDEERGPEGAERPGARAGPGSVGRPEPRESDRSRRWAWLLGGAFGLLLVTAAVGLYVGLTAGEEGPSAASPGTGDAPLSEPAEVVDFPTLAGDTASLADYRGQVVVLNLWGTWCPPCRREIPDLVKLQERIEPRGGTVIGLAVDSGDPASIREFAEEFGMNYPIWYGQGQEVVRHYRAMGYPTTYVIDPEGIVRGRHLGPQTAESLFDEVEPLLPEG